MDIDTNRIYSLMRQSGMGAQADALERGEATIGKMCRVLDQVSTTSTTQLTPARTDWVPPGGQYPTPMPCSSLEQLVKATYGSTCGRIPDDCLAQWIGLAIGMTSYAEVRDDMSIADLQFRPSGLTPTGTAANGDATTFVAGFPVTPAHSILLEVRPYRLPFNPRCLWGIFAFNGGVSSDNYLNVLVKPWVGPRGLTGSFDLRNTLYEWNPKNFIYGSQFRCADGCSDVALRGLTGCTDADIIGVDSTLYLQVDNLATASNNITAQQVVLKLGGFKTPCCNDCALGRSCGCGGGNHNH